MEEVFKYIIGLGAAVMMPIIFTILGVCIGIKLPKALKSGLLVGVGFVGLSVVTALLTSSLGPALSKMVEIYGLELGIFDMGWPSAAAVAYNTSVGAFIIPVCLGINLLMLLTKTTRTVNIDLWNYWHFAFIGAIVYFASDNIYWGFFAAIICYIITLVMADLTAPAFQKFYDKMDGISIPQPFCQSFVPFAIVINKLLDKIPGFDKLNIDSEGLKRNSAMGEPLFLGIVIGLVSAHWVAGSWKEVVDSIPSILGLGIKMGAVMELIPRITSLFIEGLKPISDATRELIAKKYKNSAGLSIGMSPALVIGHPTTLVVSLLLDPCHYIPCSHSAGQPFLTAPATLAGMFYLFPMILPITKGNVVKSFIIGLVALIVGLYFVTELAGFFTLAAKDVYAATGDPTVNIPAGFEGGALDFASSLFCWGIFHLTYSLKIIGPAILVVLALGMAIYNRIRMTRNDAKEALNNK